MNLDRIEAILRLLQRQQHVGELTVEGEGWKLRALKGRGAYYLPPDVIEEPEVPEVERHVVRAAIVGTFRAGEQVFRPADYIAQGTVLGNIDSMHILTPVPAEESGYLLDVLVQDGDPVEYGQELFVLTPDSAVARGET